MIELDVVVAWLASVAGGADCGICNAINNGFDNLLSQAVGAAGAAGAAAGTVAGGAAAAYREARDRFNQSYDRASGGTNSDGASTPGQFPPIPPGTPGQFPPISSGNPFATAFADNPFARALAGTPPSTQMPTGTLKYFNLGAPSGPQIGSQQ